jgi:AcrR family transcriptional regulator
VGTALRLVDAEGLGALSMRRLGQELDAGATSLYWHIRNKDELLDLLLDRIIAEVVAETPIGSDDWRATAMDAARTFRRVLLRHRNVTPVMGARPTLGPSALRGMDTIIGIFIDAGFDPREAVLAANAIVNWAAGFAVFEARQPLGINATPEEQAGYLEDYNGFLASLPRDEYPMMTHMATVMAECTPDVQFEYALERLLDGIEAQRAVPGAPA